MTELAPEDTESTEEYSDRLDKGFKSIKFNMDKMMVDFFPDEDMEKRLKEIRRDVIESSGSKRALANVYRNDFAGMSPEFVEEVSQNAWGYTTVYRSYALGHKAKKDPNGEYYVSYFVPKICNVDKINLLPGVRKVQKKLGVNQARESTTGVFKIDNEAEVGQKVLSFIDMVPDDKDIIM